MSANYEQQSAANFQAWEVWQSARKTAASHRDIKEWQRLNKAMNALALNNFSPLYQAKGLASPASLQVK